MSAKLIRQPDQLALVGVPASAGAAAAGVEAAPAALRQAGIVERLREVGYQVTDGGDLPEQVQQPDPENPRARNLKGVLATLDILKPRIEAMAKAHDLPLVLGGDSTIVMALAAGLRRQAASLGWIQISRYADLHTPQKTDDGLVEPMMVSHLIGQGAAEMVRFWKEPPVVREPDLALFGLGAPDVMEEQRLARLAVRRFPLEWIRQKGARAAAETVLDRVRGDSRDFAIHLSLDAIARAEFPAADRGGEDGLSLAELTEALDCFVTREKFAGLSVSGYNPALDADGRCAGILVDLIVRALAARHTALLHPPVEEAEAEAEGSEETQAEAKAKAGEEPETKLAPQSASEPVPAAEPAESAEPASSAPSEPVAPATPPEPEAESATPEKLAEDAAQVSAEPPAVEATTPVPSNDEPPAGEPAESEESSVRSSAAASSSPSESDPNQG